MSVLARHVALVAGAALALGGPAALGDLLEGPAALGVWARVHMAQADKDRGGAEPRSGQGATTGLGAPAPPSEPGVRDNASDHRAPGFAPRERPLDDNAPEFDSRRDLRSRDRDRPPRNGESVPREDSGR